MFGTNGIREVVGQKLTVRFVTDLASAVAYVHPGPGPAVVGTDARTSSPALGRVVSGALSMAGLKVLEIGVLPTPAIQYNVKALRATFGLIVTASHNPPEFNGLKGIAPDGLEFTKETERAVEAAYAGGKFLAQPYDRIGEIGQDTQGASRYVEGILSRVSGDAIRKRKLRVVLDCSNGASVVTSPMLLARLGARYVTLNANPDGTFPGHNSEPTEDNLQGLVQYVRTAGADFGVAHDGDADRAVFVDERGVYVPGEKILTLLARETIKLNGGGTVVTPVTSSDAVAEVIAPYGGKVHFTRVGSPVVSRAMQEQQGAFGGEENGGLIFADHQLARDGAMSLARVMDVLVSSGRTLSQLVADLPPYHLVKRKVRCPIALREKVLAEIPALMDRGNASEVSTLDGVKVRTPEGWVLVRPSGTEPIYRIFAESRDRKTAEGIAEKMAKSVESLVASMEGAA
ncbi:MAG: phosphoglucosamine mutase [Candidatus Thermoplasmatota archaeon]|jgi:phosphomannomutase/phosphoglucomutase|nr:phosphoglucosamine mutase [Candidatus Thermoplasmatota archaeon]